MSIYKGLSMIIVPCSALKKNRGLEVQSKTRLHCLYRGNSKPAIVLNIALKSFYTVKYETTNPKNTQFK